MHTQIELALRGVKHSISHTHLKNIEPLSPGQTHKHINKQTFHVYISWNITKESERIVFLEIDWRKHHHSVMLSLFFFMQWAMKMARKETLYKLTN